LSPSEQHNTRERQQYRARHYGRQCPGSIFHEIGNIHSKDAGDKRLDHKHDGCQGQLFHEYNIKKNVTHEVERMICVAQGANHGPAPIPEEGRWVMAREVRDISGLTHGVGWCAPQQGACKLTLNVKEGVIQEALVVTIVCTGMTHSAAMASEILPGKTILEALNTDLVCDAINTAMRDSSCKSFSAGPRQLSRMAVCPSGQEWKILERACVQSPVRCMEL